MVCWVVKYIPYIYVLNRLHISVESHLNTKHNDNLQGGTNSKNVTHGMLYHSSIQTLFLVSAYLIIKSNTSVFQPYVG